MPAKFSILALAATPFLSIALACGGDDDGGGGGIHVVDANNGGGGSDSGSGSGSADCFVDPSHTPSFGSDTQAASTNGSGASGADAHAESWQGLLNTDAAPDIVQLELYAGFGLFAGKDIAPGTYPLTGDELNYASCGVCVRIFADATEQALGAQYFATGGSVTLSSTTGNLVGTLDNVTFTKVTIADDFTSTPVGDGCETVITAASMDTPLVEDMGSGSGSATAGASARLIGSVPVVIRNRRH